MSDSNFTTSDRHLRGLTSGPWDEVRRGARRFLEALRRGERPSIADYLPEDVEARRAALIELTHEELEFRIGAGEAVGAGDYLARFPELGDDPEVERSLRRAEARLGARSGAAIPAASEGERRLGRFVIRRESGRGGFGIVYLALDERLGREVALKLPRPGAITSAEDEGRFLREARSVAQLSHPHIVPVFDAGDIDGTLYLASAYIAGATLADWAKERRPAPEQAAELVATLAEALHHAHGHGVIHRDIKPSNILVDLEGRPHLADFGLAKSPSDDPPLTIEGQLLGTPAYMSPEQARGDSRAADERSDIYSLGVVLYELLGGAPPFRGTHRMVLAQVLEDDPLPLRRLNERIALDLETACLKAMAKEPGGRYETAADFAADLRRFLRGEPVRARPVGPMGRLWRRVRRRPITSGALAATVLVVLASLAVVTGQFRRAERQRARAERGLAEARYYHRRLLTALASGRQAIVSLSAMHQKLPPLRPDEVVASPDSPVNVLNRYRSFLDYLRAEPSLQPDLCRVYQHAAELTTQTGPPELALGQWEQALDTAEGLVRMQPRNPAFRLAVVRCRREMRRLEAEMGHDQECARHLREALTACRLAHDLLAPSLQEHPRDLGLQELSAEIPRALADLLLEAGSSSPEIHRLLEGSVACCERLEREYPGRGSILAGMAESRLMLGRVHRDAGRLPEASRLLTQAREAFDRLAGEDPDDPSKRFRAAVCWSEIAGVHRRGGRLAEEIRALDQSRRRLESLVREYPGYVSIQPILADCCADLGEAFHASKAPEDAARASRRAVELWEGLASRRPSRLAFRFGLARACYWTGASQNRLGKPAEALSAYRRAAELFEEIDREAPGTPGARASLAASYHNIGNLSNDLGQPGDALDAFEKSLALREDLVRERPDDAGSWSDCAGTWHGLGETLERLGRADEAARAYRRAVGHQRVACARAPDSARFRRYLDGHLARLDGTTGSTTPSSRITP